MVSWNLVAKVKAKAKSKVKSRLDRESWLEKEREIPKWTVHSFLLNTFLLQLLRKIKRYFLLLKLSCVKLSLTQNIAQEWLKTKSILVIGIKPQKCVACFQNYLISKRVFHSYVFWVYILKLLLYLTKLTLQSNSNNCNCVYIIIIVIIVSW